MFILTTSLTYFTLISAVSSECAYFNTYYYLYPLEVCLQASGQSYSSHWQRCESGTIYWDKFSTADCSGSAISTIYDNSGIWNCESGTGHDCDYIIIRNSGSSGSCPNGQTGPYVDWAYVVRKCFNSDLYSNSDGKTMVCSSGTLNYGTCYNCVDGTCQVKDKIKINDQCNNYGQWLSLPYGCGNYDSPESGHGPITTETPTTTTTTEPPVECEGAMVTGISHYLPWITSYTIDSDAIVYTYQSPGHYYLIYPCEVVGSYALPFELYVKLKKCWDRPQHNYSCLDSVVLKLLPRHTNPILIEMNGFKQWTTLLTIDGKYVYNDLPLKSQKFSGDGISGSYDIEIIETEFINGEKNQITVHIDGSGCDPALRFTMQSMWLYIDCPKCYTDNICGVLGHWDELNGNMTFPIKDQPVFDSIDVESEYELKQFFESWEKTVPDISGRRMISTNPADFPDICQNSEYNAMKLDIQSKCRAVQDKDCCDEIYGVCDSLRDVCKYDICACVESLNNTNYTYSYDNQVPVNYSDLVDICMHNITQFPKSFNATCNELRWTVDVNEYYGEYNKFTYKLLAFYLLILIIPVAVGVYFVRMRKQIDNEGNNDIGDDQGIKQGDDDIDLDVIDHKDNNNNYSIIQQFDDNPEGIR